MSEECDSSEAMDAEQLAAAAASAAAAAARGVQSLLPPSSEGAAADCLSILKCNNRDL